MLPPGGHRVSYKTSLSFMTESQAVPFFSTVLFLHYLGARFLDISRVVEHTFLWMTILSSIVCLIVGLTIVFTP
jgi:hypothetical protein